MSSNQAPIPHYSQEQILAGLRDVWPQATGGSKPFDDLTNLYHYMKDDGSLGEIDLADLFYRLEKFFGFSCDIEQWKTFFGFEEMEKLGEAKYQEIVVPRLTFGALAEFIRQRTAAVLMEPIEVLGASCNPAGIFQGIEEVARQIESGLEPFAPSTPIRDRFRGAKLDRFWSRLRWISENRLPELPEFWKSISFYATLISFLLFLGGLFFSFRNKPWSLAITYYTLAVFLWIFGRLYYHFINPLPKNIRTFRDLAKELTPPTSANDGTT